MRRIKALFYQTDSTIISFIRVYWDAFSIYWDIYLILCGKKSLFLHQ